MKKFFLQYHLNKYPHMTNQDIIKLIYQETLGPNHIIVSKESALKYISEELSLENNFSNNLYEYLGPNYVRLDIHKYYQYYNTIEPLCELLIESTCKNNDIEKLRNNLEEILSKDALSNYNFLPVSHSDQYREKYLPHYRIIKSSFITFDHKVKQITNYIDQLPINSIISLEGRCASGKTTLCNSINHLYTIIPIDDFFLPIKLKTKERLNEIGGNINYELIKEMLIELKDAISTKKETFSYKAFNCSTQEYFKKEVILKDKIILEGVYSSSPHFKEFIDKIIYLYVDKKTQYKRIHNRDLRDKFINEWIPLEENYYNSINIEDICDIII